MRVIDYVGGPLDGQRVPIPDTHRGKLTQYRDAEGNSIRASVSDRPKFRLLSRYSHGKHNYEYPNGYRRASIEVNEYIWEEPK